MRESSNFDNYKALGIPCARNHDASFYSGYGKKHSVDVHERRKRRESQYYLLDEDHGCTLISEEIFTSDSFAVYRTFPLHVTYLIKITAL
ncbi:MAG: hypothetical protein IKM52_01075 [Clostridia bacterium]|nr:hypothetical protein [Clostridia bacterium]